jgi:hypothetical protein
MFNRLSQLVLAFIILASLGLTVGGLFATERTHHVLSASFSSITVVYYNYSFYFFASTALLFLLGLCIKVARLTFMQSSAFIVLLACLVTGQIWPIFVATTFFFSSYLVGSQFCKYFKFSQAFSTTGIFLILIGAGFYGSVLYLLASFALHYPGVYGLMLAIPIALFWVDAKKAILGFANYLALPSDLSILNFLILTVVMMYLGISLMPEVGHDALVVHLFIPAHIALNGFWGFNVDVDLWAAIPMLGDIFFAIGYVLGGEVAARLINLGFVFSLTLLIREYLIYLKIPAFISACMMLLFLSTPLAFLENSSLYIDSVWTAYVVGGAFFIFRFIFDRENKNENIIFASILLGLSMMVKVQTLWVGPGIIFVCIVFSREWASKKITLGIICSAILFVLISCPPYLRAYWITGNPIFPFFNKIFKSPQWVAENFLDTRWNQGFNWDFPYQIVFNAGKFLEGYAGSPGFQWIIFMPIILFSLLIIGNKKLVAIFLLLIITIAVTFNSAAYLRYIYPSSVWFCIIIGCSVYFLTKQTSGKSYKYLLGLALLLTVILNLIFIKSATHYGAFSFAPLISDSKRKEYLLVNMPIRSAVDLVNTLNTANTPVAILAPSPLVAGLKADAYSSSWYSYKFYEAIKLAKTSAELVELFREFNIDFFILDGLWGDEKQREALLNIYDPIKKYGNIVVGKIKEEYKFGKELIADPSFQIGVGWKDIEGKEFGGEIAKVTVGNPITIRIQVTPNREYLSQVRVICPTEPTQARNQINWLDANLKIVKSDIQVFKCGKDSTENIMKALSPASAKYVDLYASSHLDLPVIFTKVSFKF